MLYQKPDYKKITQALNYIAEKEGGDIKYLKAIKLLYLADRLHLRKYGSLITSDEMLAMKNGTLGSQTRDIITLYSYLPHVVHEYVKDKIDRTEIEKKLIKAMPVDRGELAETDLECVDKVYAQFGGMTEFHIANKITHLLPEWKRHEYDILSGQVKSAKMEYVDMFKNPLESNEDLDAVFDQTDEELEMSKEVFFQHIESEFC